MSRAEWSGEIHQARKAHGVTVQQVDVQLEDIDLPDGGASVGRQLRAAASLADEPKDKAQSKSGI